MLVTGASGGVGRLAVQLARRAGAHVTAVVGSPERGAGLSELGADEIVVGVAAEGPSFDLALESVGGSSLAAALARIAQQGAIVSFGNSSREPTKIAVSGFSGRASGARLHAFLIFADLEQHGGVAFVASPCGERRRRPAGGVRRPGERALVRALRAALAVRADHPP